MRIVFLHRYPRSAASFRARCECYFPYLEKNGISFVYQSLFDDEYLNKKYSGKKISSFLLLKYFFKRVFFLFSLKKDDLVILYQELFPYMPGIFETWLKWRGIRFIYDFDDPFFHFYQLHPKFWIRSLLGRKIERIIKKSVWITPGNEYLAQYASQFSKNITVVPSVISIARYNKQKETVNKSDPLTIGWIGTPSTVPHLLSALPALKKFCLEKNAKLLLVGSGPVKLNGFAVETRSWSESRELDDILDMDVGIMPLPDEPFTRGKGGMKLMQAMACGIGVIGSPVGFNSELIKNGKNGLLASTDEEWFNALQAYNNDRDFLNSVGKEGRKTIEENYCLEKTAGQFVSVISRFN